MRFFLTSLQKKVHDDSNSYVVEPNSVERRHPPPESSNANTEEDRMRLRNGQHESRTTSAANRLFPVFVAVAVFSAVAPPR